MIIQLNMTGSEPLYLQLRNQIVIGIGRGELALGEKLPTIRQLAQETGINAMTINKAYALLKSEGYIEIDRRHGARVNPSLAGASQPAPHNSDISNAEPQPAPNSLTATFDDRQQPGNSDIFSNTTNSSAPPDSLEDDLRLLITESALMGVGKQQLLALCENLYDNLAIRVQTTTSATPL